MKKKTVHLLVIVQNIKRCTVLLLKLKTLIPNLTQNLSRNIIIYSRCPNIRPNHGDPVDETVIVLTKLCW